MDPCTSFALCVLVFTLGNFAYRGSILLKNECTKEDHAVKNSVRWKNQSETRANRDDIMDLSEENDIMDWSEENEIMDWSEENGKTEPALFFVASEFAEFSIEPDGRIEQRLKSLPGAPFSVVFKNTAKKPVDLFWDNGGQGVWQGVLRPNQVLSITTYPGHAFYFTPQNYRSKLKRMEIKPSQTEYSIGENEFERIEGTGCVDRYDHCPASAGRNGQGCEANPGWMIVNCAHSCNMTSDVIDYCALRDPKKRCAPENLGVSTEDILSSGSLDERFNDVLTNEHYKKFSPTLVSRDPWVLMFETFLTDAECDAVLGTVGPFERSTDTGGKNALGEAQRVLSKGRTSSNAWCRNRCENHPEVKSIIRKIVNVTGVPYDNYESFQVLEYNEGQFYNTHNDRGYRKDDVTGGRILTFFLYCSDVEEGGETQFPTLNITVKPKRGRAVVWPSVRADRPTVTEHRTIHTALPVIKGQKLAANAWIHQRNFAVPNKWGCTGSFD